MIVILTGVRFYLISIWFGFPRWLVILRIFVSVGYLYVFSGKLSIQWLCPLLKSSYLGFAPPQGWVVWFLYIVWILTSYWMYYLQIFSLLHEAAFLFRWWFPSLCESFLIWCNPICLCLLLFPLPAETDSENYCWDRRQRVYCLCSPLGVLWSQVI